MTIPAPPGDQRPGDQRPGDPRPGDQIPAGQEPPAQDPKSQEPESKEPASKEPESQEPTGQEPLAQGQAAQDQTAQDPASQEPVAQEQAGQEPAAQEQAGQAPWGPPPPGSAPAPWPQYPPPPPSPSSSPYAHPYPYPVPPPPDRNAMGVASLVLGLAGVALGLAVVLFWMSWLPALLAVIFGFIGLSHARKGLATNKGMALAGVILGGAGLLIAAGLGTLAVVGLKMEADDARAKKAADRAAVAEEKDRQAREKEREEREERARHLAFGEAYTFKNGLKVTVAKPEPFVPDEFAFGHTKGNKAIQVTITVVNTGKERLSIESGLPRVNDADGASTEMVIDGSGRQKVLSGYVLPGREAVGKYAFSLPPDAADKVEVEFTPDAGEWEDSYWSGPN
ncbi:DUF4190 domain-containing protein [Streptomyces sp. NPDC050617]|uniref:DUF4190 domain-containing protein n=1 Tax=Streptomyces sp. NPDC050617 TaxID=3154628 RepID=UPI00341CE9F5